MLEVGSCGFGGLTRLKIWCRGCRERERRLVFFFFFFLSVVLCGWWSGEGEGKIGFCVGGL